MMREIAGGRFKVVDRPCVSQPDDVAGIEKASAEFLFIELLPDQFAESAKVPENVAACGTGGAVR